MQPCVFIPPTRLVIRKYAVHVRSGVITGLAVVLRVFTALYIEHVLFLIVLQCCCKGGEKKAAPTAAAATKQA